MRGASTHVCFTPESGHVRRRSAAQRFPLVAGRETHLGVATSTVKVPPDVMVATRNIDRYPVARQNQAIPEFDPIALRTADAKRPTTHIPKPEG
jgi:hypothetical protein